MHTPILGIGVGLAGLLQDLEDVPLQGPHKCQLDAVSN